MFLKKTAIKKMIKQARKDGELRCGYCGSWFVVTGIGSYCINVHKSALENWLKAAIVDEIGFLPESGMNSVDYDGNVNYSMELSSDNLGQTPYQSNYYLTPMVYVDKLIPLRLVQSLHDFSIKAISEGDYQMIDLKELELDENPPTGPFFDGRNMIFRNETCRIGIPAVKCGRADDIMRVLSGVEFNKRGDL